MKKIIFLLLTGFIFSCTIDEGVEIGMNGESISSAEWTRYLSIEDKLLTAFEENKDSENLELVLVGILKSEFGDDYAKFYQVEELVNDSSRAIQSLGSYGPWYYSQDSNKYMTREVKWYKYSTWGYVIAKFWSKEYPSGRYYADRVEVSVSVSRWDDRETQILLMANDGEVRNGACSFQQVNSGAYHKRSELVDYISVRGKFVCSQAGVVEKYEQFGQF